MPDASVFPLLCADLLRSGETVRFRATGASMGPAIRDGDVLTVAPVVPHAIKRGDVILYTADRGLTAHRVVEFRRGSAAFITQGDAPGSPRELIGAGAVLGRVESVERCGIGLPSSGPFGRCLARLVGLASRLARRTPLQFLRRQR